MRHLVFAARLEDAAVREEDRSPRKGRHSSQFPGREGGLRNGKTGQVEDMRCSLDPMRETDRYRLVTPYFDSSKDL
jgi:hypothetical protein